MYPGMRCAIASAARAFSMRAAADVRILWEQQQSDRTHGPRSKAGITRDVKFWKYVTIFTPSPTSGTP